VEGARKRKLFTLRIFVLIVASLSLAFLIAPPTCTLTPRQASEAVLRQNLDTLRKTIDAYTYDKRKAPQSLDDLIAAGYLKKIPIDPMTNQADWEVVTEDTLASIDQTEPGINDVHSASLMISTEGTEYNSW
jgi:general secretion pathway protein G